MKKTLCVIGLLLMGTAGFGQENTDPITTDPDQNDNNAVTLLSSDKIDVQIIEVAKADEAPVIDGRMTEPVWKSAAWHPIDQFWLGQPVDESDFKGRFKLCWTPEALYVLAEIHDDILYDQREDPLQFWWDDDCVEVFLDEDNSGGEHQYNHNAFAYHVALDGNVVDMAPGEMPRLYNDHVESKFITKGSKSLWELKFYIFDDSYTDEAENVPVLLSANKKMGFAIAYCDNDSSEQRENFIGSIVVAGPDKNRGWIDANIFGTLLLID